MSIPPFKASPMPRANALASPHTQRSPLPCVAHRLYTYHANCGCIESGSRIVRRAKTCDRHMSSSTVSSPVSVNSQSPKSVHTFVADGDTIWVAFDSGKLQLVDVASDGPPVRLPEHRRVCAMMCLRPGVVVIGTDDGAVSVWHDGSGPTLVCNLQSAVRRITCCRETGAVAAASGSHVVLFTFADGDANVVFAEEESCAEIALTKTSLIAAVGGRLAVWQLELATISAGDAEELNELRDEAAMHASACADISYKLHMANKEAEFLRAELATAEERASERLIVWEAEVAGKQENFLARIQDLEEERDAATKESRIMGLQLRRLAAEKAATEADQLQQLSTLQAESQTLKSSLDAIAKERDAFKVIAESFNGTTSEAVAGAHTTHECLREELSAKKASEAALLAKVDEMVAAAAAASTRADDVSRERDALLKKLHAVQEEKSEITGRMSDLLTEIEAVRVQKYNLMEKGNTSGIAQHRLSEELSAKKASEAALLAKVDEMGAAAAAANTKADDVSRERDALLQKLHAIHQEKTAMKAESTSQRNDLLAEISAELVFVKSSEASLISEVEDLKMKLTASREELAAQRVSNMESISVARDTVEDLKEEIATRISAEATLRDQVEEMRRASVKSVADAPSQTGLKTFNSVCFQAAPSHRHVRIQVEIGDLDPLADPINTEASPTSEEKAETRHVDIVEPPRDSPSPRRPVNKAKLIHHDPSDPLHRRDCMWCNGKALMALGGTFGILNKPSNPSKSPRPNEK